MSECRVYTIVLHEGLRRGFYCFFCCFVYTRPVGALGGSVSTSHLTTGMLGLEDFSTASGFAGVLEVKLIRFVQLMQYSVCYLPDPNFNFK